MLTVLPVYLTQIFDIQHKQLQDVYLDSAYINYFYADIDY